MVVKQSASFTVELVNALTKEPFIEHSGSDGKIYVEVEPEADYFIKISSSVDPKVQKLVVGIEIDGNDIGYDTYLHPYKNCTLWEGYYERKGGKVSETSFKFAKKTKSHDESSINECGNQLLMGRIVVTFWGAVQDGISVPNDIETSLGANAFQITSKSVETAKGSIVNDMNEVNPNYRDKPDYSYKRGKLLEKNRIGLLLCSRFDYQQNLTQAASLGDASFNVVVRGK